MKVPSSIYMPPDSRGTKTLGIKTGQTVQKPPSEGGSQRSEPLQHKAFQQAGELNENKERKLAEKLKEKNQESRERLEEIKAEANQLLTKFNIQLDFNVDNDLGSLVVEVRN